MKINYSCAVLVFFLNSYSTFWWDSVLIFPDLFLSFIGLNLLVGVEQTSNHEIVLKSLLWCASAWILAIPLGIDGRLWFCYIAILYF